MRRLFCLFAAAVAAAGPGCATVATGGGGDQTVRVVTDPPGAAVVVDGRPAGTTPLELPLRRRSEHRVEVVAPGYEPAVAVIDSNLNPWVFGNVVVGGLIGVAVDVATGATFRLAPNELNLRLRPAGSPATQPTGPYPPTPPGS